MIQQAFSFPASISEFNICHHTSSSLKKHISFIYYTMKFKKDRALENALSFDLFSGSTKLRIISYPVIPARCWPDLPLPVH